MRFIYSGSELDALAGAQNYYRWLLRRFSPYVGGEVIEIGAGTGTFSQLLLTLPQVKRRIAIEPSNNNFPLLSQRLATQARATAVKGYLKGSTPPESADSLVAVNVLEHGGMSVMVRSSVRPALNAGSTTMMRFPLIISHSARHTTLANTIAVS